MRKELLTARKEGGVPKDPCAASAHAVSIRQRDNPRIDFPTISKARCDSILTFRLQSLLPSDYRKLPLHACILGRSHDVQPPSDSLRLNNRLQRPLRDHIPRSKMVVQKVKLWCAWKAVSINAYSIL